jgi:alanine racemase
VGYNATCTAQKEHELAVLNVGYADGYLRCFSGGAGRAISDKKLLPVAGRVSMDLTTIVVDEAPQLREGDWVELEFDLPAASIRSGLTQYELLTSLGSRYERIWS